MALKQVVAVTPGKQSFLGYFWTRLTSERRDGSLETRELAYVAVNKATNIPQQFANM